MNKQLANFGRRLSTAEMKKTTGGIRVGTGSRCYPIPGPCITTYTPGGQDCCKECCSRTCYAAQQADPPCSGVIIPEDEK